MKSIFKSKTFWLNVASTAVTLASSGMFPAKVAVPVLAAANVAVRLFFTNQGAYVIPPAK